MTTSVKPWYITWWGLGLIVLVWVGSAIPLGVAFYAVKDTWGLNIFKGAGFHALRHCLRTEFQSIQNNLTGESSHAP